MTPGVLPEVRAKLNVDLPGPTISRHLYGHFAEHLGRGIYGGFLVDESSGVPTRDGIRLDVVEALRAIEIPNLRWPGGLFADEYHWRDGVGPRPDRPSMVNRNWGEVIEDNSFGTHEFMQLCELLGAEPYISANIGTGTVREASEWVEYLTRDDESPMARLRRANGRDAAWPLHFWGLGNEPWGGGGRFSPEAYAQVARTFGLFSRDYGDNQLYRIAAGASDDDYRWTETLMKALGFQIGSGRTQGEGVGAFQAISFHHYTMPGTWTSKGSATDFSRDEYLLTIAEAARVETLLAGHSAIMDAYDPGHTIGLVLDEWGTWFEAEPGSTPGFLFQQNTLRDALVAAIHFDAFHRHAERLVMANVAQTINVLQAMIHTDGDTMVLTPSYHVFEMNKGHHDARRLDVNLVTPLPMLRIGDRDVPSVSLSASTKGGTILISMTNAAAEDGVSIVLDLRGADLAAPIGRVLTAGDIRAHNTRSAPVAVAPRELEAIRLEGQTLRADLPAHSFATVEVPVTGG